MLRAAVLSAALLAARAAEIEIMLPMRDGVKLHTLVDFPLFWQNGTSQPLAVLMER